MNASIIPSAHTIENAMDTNRAILAAILFLFPLIAHAQNIATKAEDISNDLGELNLSAGVSERQALILAQQYCDKYIAGCGSAYPAKSRGSSWDVPVRTGVSAHLEAHPVSVEKHTGKMSWGDGPTLLLTEILHSTDPAPTPLNAKLYPLSGDELASAVKIQFHVRPSGTTEIHSILRSAAAGGLECDFSARRTVAGWKFPPRKEGIMLVASLKSGCIVEKSGSGSL
jgi:hypothetical protein